MDTSELAVLIGSIAAVAFTLWYFFGPRKSVQAAAGGGVQAMEIEVEGGYSPDVITVKAGTPVRLTFHRTDTSSCSEQVLFPDFGIARTLPLNERTTIEFTPEKPGEYPFHCSMNMLRGRLIVRP
jgi:plastocyanin domain-containing protein